MKIKQIFEKPIDRYIEGVIKADDLEHILIELEEYEITWEKLKTEEEANGEEWAALKLYCDKYHEGPPLNLSLGRSKGNYEADEFVKSVIL